MKNKIAVLSNGWSSELVEYIIKGLQSKAKNDGIDIFAFITYPSYESDSQYNDYIFNMFRLINADDFDGAIILSNTFNPSNDIDFVYQSFQEAKVPMITIETEYPFASCIKSENYKGVYDLATHLIEKHGAKKIVYVNGALKNTENKTRKQALIDVLAKHNLSLEGELSGEFSFYSSYNAVDNYLADRKLVPDAFVCANDQMALGVTSALFNHGYNVPRDVIVTGFDKARESQFNIPNIATVSRGWEHFGEIAYEKLMYLIANPSERIIYNYESEFIPGESCGCPAAPDVESNRFAKVQTSYFDSVKTLVIDRIFRKLQLSLTSICKKEDFHKIGEGIIDTAFFLGKDFCICTEPNFFDQADAKSNIGLNGYSSKLDVIYESKNGKSTGFNAFDSSELYPNYKHIEGESNTYIFSPLTYTNYTIGYIAIKNNTESIFNQSLGVLCMDMDALLISMQRYFISERNNRRLESIYMTDALTGIYNRTGCEKVLFEFIEGQQANNKTTLLAFADIDNMKGINDSFGHLNGDLAIKAAADAFQECTSEDWLFARYGGDEFIAVGDCTDMTESDIETFFAAIDEKVEKYVDNLNLSFNLRISVGYSIIPANATKSIAEYLDDADNIMYDNKTLHKI